MSKYEKIDLISIFVSTPDPRNEITAIPDLLKILSLKGCIVSIDAMGCQKDIAKMISQQNADYLLAVKQNQPALFDDIKLFFDDFMPRDPKLFDYFETIEKDHDRIKTRQYSPLLNAASLLPAYSLRPNFLLNLSVPTGQSKTPVIGL